VKRPVIIVAAVVAFLAVSFVVARWLNNDTVERAQVTELLEDQIRGDAAAMLRRLEDCDDPGCVAIVRRNAARLRGPGELKIALYQSQTAHALTSRTRFTRVVWFTPERLTTVQCVLVRRKGNVFAGTTVSLLRVTAPIGREASCPSNPRA
jgi:phage terminase large subunit-like protein